MMGRSGKAQPGLFAPLVLAQAAEIEAIDLGRFLHDPTKLAKGLTALNEALTLDGITTTAADGLLAEAAGAELDWEAYPPAVTGGPARGGSLPQDVAERAVVHPRVTAAAEATARLAAAAPGEPALVAALTGPYTLARQLGGDWFDGVALSGHESLGPFIEAAGAIVLEVAKLFLETGTNLMLLVENAPPPVPAHEAWRSVLTPVVNVTRFRQAVPVVVISDPAADLSGVPASVGLCAHAGTALAGPANRLKGVALSVNPKEWQSPPPGCPLVTTTGAVPGSVDFAVVLDACRLWRSPA
jgi:hypothetical protein